MTARTPVVPAYGAPRRSRANRFAPRRGPSGTGLAAVTERRYPDMWVDPEDDPRETGATPVGEQATCSSSTSTTTG